MPGAAGGGVPGLITDGVSKGHPDGGGWEGGVVLWFYKAALKEDEMNIVWAWLTHAAQVLMCMAGTVEAPDCGGLACTCSSAPHPRAYLLACSFTHRFTCPPTHSVWAWPV